MMLFPVRVKSPRKREREGEFERERERGERLVRGFPVIVRVRLCVLVGADAEDAVSSSARAAFILFVS